jgi:hypothetical protein
MVRLNRETGGEHIDTDTAAHVEDAVREQWEEKRQRWPEGAERFPLVRLVRLVEVETIEAYPTQAQDAPTARKPITLEEVLTGVGEWGTKDPKVDPLKNAIPMQEAAV